MSVWKEIHQRSNGITERKEDSIKEDENECKFASVPSDDEYIWASWNNKSTEDRWYESIWNGPCNLR